MIDFVLAAALALVSVMAVRRVRTQGFASLWQPNTLVHAARTAVARAGSGAALGSGTSDGIRRIRLRIPEATVEAAPLPAAATARPRVFIAAWTAGLLLVAGAIALQRELWVTRESLLPFWMLLAVGAVFAVVIHVGLRLPDPGDAEPARPSPPAPDVPDPRFAMGDSAVSPAIDASSGRGGTGEPEGSGPAARWPPWWMGARGWQLIAAAIGLEAAALLIWSGGQTSTLAWILHLTAGPAFLTGVWALARPRIAPLLGTWTIADTAAIVGLMLIGAIPRFWQIGAIPEGVWFDEAARGLEALKIAADPAYRPVFVSQILQEPTAFWYLIVPFVQMMGRDPAALRLPSAIAGTLGIAAVYLLARALFDRRTALIAAGLTIGMTWHLNYSRIAFLAIWSVMLDALAAGLFVLAYRQRSVFLYAAAGLIGGAAIHFYYSSRLLPAILAVVVLYWLIAERTRFLRTHGVGLAACGLGFVLAAAPIAEYAVLHPKEFSARTETVSVFKEVEQAGSWDPLIHSVKAHLLMFNVRGDHNGRHNWTGRPMLDSVIGGLGVLGLGLAVVRWRRWRYAILLAWVPLMLLGGTLSLSWEAPQSHRSVEEVTAVAILAALPLSVLWHAAGAVPVALRALARRGKPLPDAPAGGADVAAGAAATAGDLGLAGPEVLPGGAGARALAVAARSFGAVVVAIVAAAGVLNIQRYFGPQMHDNRTWVEFSTPQTIAGRMINAVPVDWKIYVDPVFLGNPTLHFMVRGERQLAPFDPATSVPIAEPAAAVFLTNREPAAAARVVQFYPTAPRQLVMVPEGGEVGLYAFTLAPEDVQGTEGVIATYRGPDAPVVRREQRLELDWNTDRPLPPPFGATFETTLAAPVHGVYRFRVQATGDAALLVDGQPIAAPGRDGQVTLARGVHALRLELAEAGTAPVRVLWAPPNREFESIPANALHVPPVRATGLLARLYRGTEPSGEPALAKVDPAVDLRVHALPLPRPYSIEWTGAIRAHRDGTYRFGTTSVDASAVWIDGQQVVDNRRPNALAEGTVQLTAGWHDIRVRFLDASSFTHITLYWEPPEGGRQVVPTDALRPWPADRVPLAYPVDMDLSRREAPTMAVAARQSEGVGVRMLASPSILLQPRGVTVGADGTVYIADAGRPGVVVVPPDGEARVLVEGHFREPSAIAVLPNRTLAVLDAGAGAVWRVQPDGTVAERLIPDEGLYGPRGIAVSADGTIAIADTGNNRILLLLPDGSRQSLRNLKEPTDVAFLPDGNLLVAETGAKTLRVIRRNGDSVSNWSMPNAYTVVGPHVAVLPGGGWIATAPEARTLLRFPPNGRSPETWDVGVAWQKPVGIAASRAGVVVADADAAAVVRLGLP